MAINLPMAMVFNIGVTMWRYNGEVCTVRDWKVGLRVVGMGLYLEMIMVILRVVVMIGVAILIV